MSMRISSGVLLLALAACGEQRTDTATLAKVEAEARKTQDDSGNIVCAQRGSRNFRTHLHDRPRR